MTEKYLYFAKKTARSLALTDSESNVQTYTLTTSLINPLPDGVADTNTIFANGAITAELQNLHLDGSADQHVLGSHYTAAVNDGKLVIDPQALLYDGASLVTVKTVAQDPVFGVTNSSTVGENDITFTINVPMLAGDCLLQKASQFKGIEMVDNDTADIYFEPHTNDGLGNGVDKVRLSYTAGNFKALCDSINALITDERNQSGLVVVADDYRNIFLNNNIVGISAIDSITLDS
tara:strand:+ start:254 stop:955 length:702 start_codon:yes stop_codon:yes gene_type:complete